MPKSMNVRVATMDAELEFAIQTSTTGKQLFEQVVKTIGLREVWYFGLQFVDSSGVSAWIELKKKLQDQDIKKESPLQFRFRAKYFPEDVADELIQDITRHMFYLQVREEILSDVVYCPPETAVLLASYAVQTKYGDYNPTVQKSGFLEKDKLLPSRVTDQHAISKAQWEERIVQWYEEHKGMTKESAMLEYLKIAQDLEMYGVNYFEIKNKKGTDLWLGVDALGVNIYEKGDKLTPKIGFPWSDIRNVSFSNKKFVIKPIDKQAPDFVFYTARLRINKRILDLCMGNHELYMRRRKPDSIEVQQMKAQTKELRAAKELERQQLLKEKQQREEAVQKRKELEEQLARYEAEMENAKRDLAKSQSVALSLEEKMRQAEIQRREIQEAQARAEEARHLAEEAVHLEKAEREQKEREMYEAQELLERKLEEAREREDEARRLQEELEQAHLQIEENQRALQEARLAALAPPTPVYSSPPSMDETMMQSVSLEEVSLMNATPMAMQMSYETPSSNGDETRENNGVGDDYEEASEQSSQDMHQTASANDRSEEDRVTQAEKDQRITKQLASLGAELEAAKIQSQVTANDVIYRQNVSQGRDKYKTLKQIRQGNTKHRVDVFESM